MMIDHQEISKDFVSIGTEDAAILVMKNASSSIRIFQLVGIKRDALNKIVNFSMKQVLESSLF